MSNSSATPEARLEQRGLGAVSLGKFSVHARAFTTPGKPCWLIAAWPEPSHPIVERSDGLVLAIWKSRYNEDKARALFRRVLRVVAAKDLSGLRKTCRHFERDDEIFYIAFGIMGDGEALAIRRRNEAELALYHRRQAGEISQAEWERMRANLDMAMAKRRPPPRA